MTSPVSNLSAEISTLTDVKIIMENMNERYKSYKIKCDTHFQNIVD